MKIWGPAIAAVCALSVSACSGTDVTTPEPAKPATVGLNDEHIGLETEATAPTKPVETPEVMRPSFEPMANPTPTPDMPLAERNETDVPALTKECGTNGSNDVGWNLVTSRPSRVGCEQSQEAAPRGTASWKSAANPTWGDR